MRFWRSFFPGLTFFSWFGIFQSSVQSRTVTANCSEWTYLLPLDGKLWRYRRRCENISHSRNTSCSERSVELFGFSHLLLMYLVYEFFSGYLQLFKLQLRLRRSYLHLNLNFRSSHHLHSVYVPLQGMYSWHDNTRKKKTSKLTHFVALYSFDFCCCCCWLIYSSWLRGAITEEPRFFSYQRHPMSCA